MRRDSGKSGVPGQVNFHLKNLPYTAVGANYGLRLRPRPEKRSPMYAEIAAARNLIVYNLLDNKKKNWLPPVLNLKIHLMLLYPLLLLSYPVLHQ